MARENIWGYERIEGELAKLGLQGGIILLPAAPPAVGEQVRQAIESLPLPRPDLRRVYLVQPRQLIDRPFAPDRLHRDLRLERGTSLLPPSHSRGPS
jgi:hypothetical protein